MKRTPVRRNLSTPASRAWWAEAERAAAIVRTWPDWKRAGVNVVDRRMAPKRTSR